MFSCADEHGEVEGDVGDGLEEKGYSVVSTKELEDQGLTRHPDLISETASLASVHPPKSNHAMALPADILVSESFVWASRSRGRLRQETQACAVMLELLPRDMAAHSAGARANRGWLRRGAISDARSCAGCCCDVLNEHSCVASS